MKHMSGVVVRGTQQARMIGYPTANIEYATVEEIWAGVWTCWIMIRGIRHSGLAVIGMWRLLNGSPSLEVYVLDFDQDIYGETVHVELNVWLRALETFATTEKLIQRIREDVERARISFVST